MSLWFKPAVFKLKKGFPAIIMECPFILYNWLEREKQDFLGLRFWMFREQVGGKCEEISLFGVCCCSGWSDDATHMSALLITGLSSALRRIAIIE